MTVRLAACLAACPLVVACSSDFSMVAAPPDGAIEVGTPLRGPRPGTVPAPPGLPLPPDLPDPPGSPWGDLTPGNIPDLYFAVAWSEWDCSALSDLDGYEDADADGLSEADVDDGGCPVRYSVIDLYGQVIAEFPLPGESDEWTQWSHLSLAPAGPGQFLAVAESWGDAYDASGFWAGTSWQAWRGDAYTGQLEEIAHWNPGEGKAQLSATGRLIDIDWNAWAHLGIWASDPDWLVAWWGGHGCEPLREIKQMSLAGDELDRFWRPEDLLPPEMQGTEPVHLWPWNMETGLADDGHANMLLGVSDSWCTSTSPRYDLVAWSPSAGPLWTAAVSQDAPLTGARWAGHGGGAALQLDPAWGEGTWRVFRADGVVEGQIPADMYNVKAGPMLDPAGPTFMTISYVDEAAAGGGWHGALDVFHEGEPVWTIGQMRFGLQHRNVFFQDAVLLPLLPEEG